MNFYQRQLLDSEQVKTIREFSEDLEWISGMDTSTNISKVNDQAVPGGHAFKHIDSIMARSIMRDREYEMMTLSNRLTKARISKMTEGGQYPLHVDDADFGHYSTTVFLSEPDEYEGGELVLKTDSGFVEFKLPAGHAVTYLTGTPHYVNKVTSGTRLVSVYWTISTIPNSDYRAVVSKLIRAYDALPEFENVDPEADLKNPKFLIAEATEALLRICR